MSNNVVYADVDRKKVDLFFHHNEVSKTSQSTYLKTILTPEEGLQLADQIRSATLEVWPVNTEDVPI